MYLMFMILDNDRIGKHEITNPQKLIQELKKPKNKAISYVKTLLYEDTKNLIDSLNVENISDSLVRIIREDINRLILNGDINNNNETIQSFGFSKVFKEEIKTYQL